MRFLMSIDQEKIGLQGFAYTLTIRNIPKDHEEWANLIAKMRKGLRRRGAVLDHWVIEWQVGRPDKPRVAPHLHGMVYYDPNVYSGCQAYALRSHWCKLTEHLGASERCQHVELITDPKGWQKYVSKHAGRGYGHYQRERGTLPKGWQKTGRLWGKGGDWPIFGEQWEMANEDFYRFRRLVRGHLMGLARTDLRKAIKYDDFATQRKFRMRLRFLRQMLKQGDIKKSRVRGISEWVDMDVSRAIVRHLRTISNSVFVREEDSEGNVCTIDPDTGEIVSVKSALCRAAPAAMCAGREEPSP
jgi:hypothetical protein